VKIFGLIGKNLDHSWSCSFFEEKFRKENISDCRYLNFPLEEVSEIRKLVSTNRDIRGLNLTIPYKSAVIGYLDQLDFNAEQIGAVNCIRITRHDGLAVLKGFNTDYLAFFRTILPLIPTGIEKSLILGNGGAAKAVSFALRMAGIGVTIVSRRHGAGDLHFTEVDGNVIRDHQLIVNATPAGSVGSSESLPPLPYEALNERHILYDLVYNPSDTAFLQKAAPSGARAINGMEMLTIQAELSWQIWNGS